MATQNRAPTSDEAVSGTWTGSTGTRYTVVDDYPDSSGADFLTHGTATAGNLTLGFSVFSLPAGSTGVSVQVRYYDKKNASQACNIGGRLKVGGNYYNATTHNPTNGSWVVRSDDFPTNPKTAVAWTVDDINGVGANALQAVGWVSTDASPAIDLSSIEVQVTYTPPQNSAYVSWTEAEVPNAPRVGRFSFAEFEAPSPPRLGEVSWTELEAPNAARSLWGSWTEIETPDASALRQFKLSWAESETPSPPRAGEFSWGELQLPTAPRIVTISWAEAEVPQVGAGGGTPNAWWWWS